MMWRQMPTWILQLDGGLGRGGRNDAILHDRNTTAHTHACTLLRCAAASH
jgi:hypothetical protein